MNFDDYKDDEDLANVFRKSMGNLDDYVAARIYFDDIKKLTDATESHAFLRAKAAQCTDFVAPDLAHYLWHRDGFAFEIVTQIEDAQFVGDKDVKECDFEPHLRLHIRYGDNSEDEWFLIWLLYRITKEFEETTADVWDLDGNPLLIEAGHVIPKWINPDNSEHRVFIRNGTLHILAPSTKKTPIATPRQGLQLVDALARLRKEDSANIAKSNIQRVIRQRFSNYPAKALEFATHNVRAVLPENIAKILVQHPQLISVAMDHLPPTIKNVQLMKDDRHEP